MKSQALLQENEMMTDSSNAWKNDALSSLSQAQSILRFAPISLPFVNDIPL